MNFSSGGINHHNTTYLTLDMDLTYKTSDQQIQTNIHPYNIVRILILRYLVKNIAIFTIPYAFFHSVVVLYNNINNTIIKKSIEEKPLNEKECRKADQLQMLIWLVVQCV